MKIGTKLYVNTEFRRHKSGIPSFPLELYPYGAELVVVGNFDSGWLIVQCPTGGVTGVSPEMAQGMMQDT